MQLMHHQWRPAHRIIALGLLLLFEAASAQQAHSLVEKAVAD